DFGLAVADISHEEAIHRTGLLHVALDVLGGTPLIGSVFVEKARFEFTLPSGVGRKAISGRDAPAGVQLEQLERHLPDGGAGAVTHAAPAGTAEAVEPRRRPVAIFFGTAIALDLVQPIERHVEERSALILEHRDLEGAFAHLDGLDAA